MGRSSRIKRQAREQRNEQEASKTHPLNLTAFLVICALLVAATCAVYWQTTGFDLTNCDDQIYIANNPFVRVGLTTQELPGLPHGSVGWAFNIGYGANWHPLTWLSHMVDVQMYGLDNMDGRLGPGGYHLTSVIFHILSTLLLFLVLTRITGFMWRSAFVAGLFALHPMHVESVAWVAERKDVLSTFFMMLTLLAYSWYARRTTILRYSLTLLAFVLGLMAKPMLVSLPVLLLLLDYWPLRRFDRVGQTGKLLLEKIPFLVLTIASCIITFMAQKTGEAVGSLDFLAVGVRAANAVMSYGIYVCKAFWPTNLAHYYPHPGTTWPTAEVVGCAIILAAITALAVVAARRLPYITVGWFWYVVTLVPVIGLLQVGFQARADRYTYIPLIGIFMVVAHGVPELIVRGSAMRARVLGVVAVGILAVLACMAYGQVGHWKDSEALDRSALAVTDNNWFAAQGLASVLEDKAARETDLGHVDEANRLNTEALQWVQTAINILPNFADAHNDKARALDALGRIDEAIAEYEACLRLKPEHVLAHNNIANSLLKRGRAKEAIEHYRQALQLNPQLLIAHYNLAIVLGPGGKLDEAIEHFRAVLNLHPNDYFAYWARTHMAADLAQKGQIDEARQALTEAVQINEAAKVDVLDGTAGKMLAEIDKQMKGR